MKLNSLVLYYSTFLISVCEAAVAASGFNGPLSQNAVKEATTVPANFALSFNIKPHGISLVFANILQYSKDGTAMGREGRIPMISFRPNTTNLAVRLATFSNVNEGIDASMKSLPLNAITRVRVEAFGRDVFLYLNDSFDTMATVSADRIFGAATLHVSNPWNTPASASIGSIKMNSLSALSVSTAKVFNGLLTKLAVYETTTVPANFNLTFKIKPIRAFGSLANIIHYSKDKTNAGPEGQIPAVWFVAGTTYLTVQVATLAISNEGIVSSNVSLPLNAITRVRVEAFGRDVFLYLNDSLDSMVTVSADRIFGIASLYASNPWSNTALAYISSIQMNPLTAMSFKGANNFNGRLSPLAVYEETTVPINFALEFDIKPFRTVSELSSIFHYRKSDMGSAAGIPAIWFSPGTTRLIVDIATIANEKAGIEVSNVSLPLNTTTKVRVEAFGRYVLLYLNYSLDTMVTLSADKIFGEATLYVSHPLHPPALATIGFINMVSLSTLSFKSPIIILVQAPSKTAITVPANFSLSFDIKPSRTVSGLSSIIRYCKDNTDIGSGGRMPAIWFLPGTTKLHVRVATTDDADDGIWGSIKSLPLHTTTNVRVEAFGRDIFLYLNNSLDTMATVSADRISGPASHYGSDPWWPSAQASISSIQMGTLSSKTFKTASEFNGPLSKLAVYQTTTVPANFSLSFDIKPFGTVSGLASIIHYCQNNAYVGRMPAIWFVAGTTKLHIRVATLKKANAGIFASIGSLPLHATTNVRVEALGREVFLFLNNSFDSMASLSADRIFGAATLFVSNPWQPPALATVGSIQMKSLSALTVTAASVFNGRLSKFAVYEKTTVPANFALSFKITPFEISSEWSSIIHYSKDKTNMGAGGRMPAIWLIPGTTKLSVRVATLNNVNAGIFASIVSLPLNATTNVRVEAVGREVFLFLNDSFDTMATVSADRIFGEATLFAPNPWSTAALATIGSIQMKSILKKSFYIADTLHGPLSTFAVQEKTYVPPNFSLSFDIKPLKLISELSSIIHYCKTTDMTVGGRMPAIWFLPGTTKLHVRIATEANVDEGIRASVRSLPLSATTKVRVEGNGLQVSLYLNGTLDSKVTVSKIRISGETTLFVPNPWHAPAAAIIGSIQLKSL